MYKSTSGQFYTKSLFQDFYLGDRTSAPPVFTLQVERPGFICCRTTFLEECDPTGYKWAIKYLGDWQHWKKLMGLDWFREAYDVWMDEFRAKVRSEALESIRAIAGSSSNQALPAAKYLATYEWEKQGRGRPSKAEIAGELKKQIKAFEEQDEDAQRIGLKAVSSSKAL